jgi:molecular chaperone HscB
MTSQHPLLDQDDFELFGLPRQFRLDLAQIEAQRLLLLSQTHPDRFVAQGARAQRLAMQWTVRINEAYQRLKHPLKRAVYLCELQGVPINSHSNTAMPADFLMQQIQWREALDDAHTPEQQQGLREQIQQECDQLMQNIALSLDQTHDLSTAVQQVRALMFFERFLQDIDEHIHRKAPNKTS